MKSSDFVVKQRVLSSPKRFGKSARDIREFPVDEEGLLYTLQKVYMFLTGLRIKESDREIVWYGPGWDS
jgi:hypothetical protein